jgi:hypothetical protein
LGVSRRCHESASKEDLHANILKDVAYQWDRIPLMPAGLSKIDDPNPERLDEQLQILHDPDMGLQIGEHDVLEKIFQVL